MDAAGFRSVFEASAEGLAISLTLLAACMGCPVCLRAARAVESWIAHCPVRFIDKREGGAAGGALACSWPPGPWSSVAFAPSAQCTVVRAGTAGRRHR